MSLPPCPRQVLTGQPHLCRPGQAEVFKAGGVYVVNLGWAGIWCHPTAFLRRRPGQRSGDGYPWPPSFCSHNPRSSPGSIWKPPASQLRPDPLHTAPGPSLRGDRLVSRPGPPEPGLTHPGRRGQRVLTHKHSSAEKVWHRHGGEALWGEVRGEGHSRDPPDARFSLRKGLCRGGQWLPLVTQVHSTSDKMGEARAGGSRLARSPGVQRRALLWGLTAPHSHHTHRAAGAAVLKDSSDRVPPLHKAFHGSPVPPGRVQVLHHGQGPVHSAPLAPPLSTKSVFPQHPLYAKAGSEVQWLHATLH